MYMYVYHTDILTTKIWLTLSDLSRPLKVKYDGVIGLPIYGFLLMFNSNILRRA